MRAFRTHSLSPNSEAFATTASTNSSDIFSPSTIAANSSTCGCRCCGSPTVFSAARCSSSWDCCCWPAPSAGAALPFLSLLLDPPDPILRLVTHTLPGRGEETRRIYVCCFSDHHQIRGRVCGPVVWDATVASEFLDLLRSSAKRGDLLTTFSVVGVLLVRALKPLPTKFIELQSFIFIPQNMRSGRSLLWL